MDVNSAAALATLAPYLPSITALGAAITELRHKASQDVIEAVAMGRKIDRVNPYTAGDGVSGVWTVVGVPTNYYRQLELTIHCNNATLFGAFRIALAEPLFLGVDNVVDGGSGTLCCTIACVSDGIAKGYVPILDA